MQLLSLFKMNVLERYIGRTILTMIFFAVLVLLSLAMAIKFVEEFKATDLGNYDALKAAYYTVLTFPRDLETLFPMAALIGTLLGLGSLAGSSELVVMQASGFSRFRIGLAVMKTAVPLILLTMVLSEWGAPQLEQYARNMRAVAQTGGSMMVTQGGFWARDGQNFIYIRHIKSSEELHRISIYEFNGRELKAELYSDKATFKDNGWTLHNASRVELGDTVNKTVQKTRPWQTSITPSKLTVASFKPESLSISGLSDYVGFLKETGQDTKRFEITFWRKLYQPISMSIMMLLAMSFIFGPLRSSSIGAKIIIGVIAGASFFVADVVFGNMSLVVSWLPIQIGALLPSLIGLAVIWWLLGKKRD